MTLKLNKLIWLWVMQIMLIVPALLSAEPLIHKVKKGDTLYSLSKKYGTTVNELMKLNNLSSSNLSLGQKIVVKAEAPQPKPKPKPAPAPTPAAPSATAVPVPIPEDKPAPGVSPPPAPANLSADYYYIIKPKDNLYRIAVNNGITLAELLAWNGFADTSVQIHPGDKVVIKNPATLPAGEPVPVPNLQAPTPVEKPAVASPDTVVIERVYIVQKKDTLFKIASENGMTVDDLKKLNNLTSNDIKTGMKLYLAGKPRPAAAPSTYEALTEEDVQKKDKIRSDLILPVEGKVFSEYGLRNGRPHKGIDLGAKTGTPIYAVLDGTVVYSGVQGSYGNVVVIEHPDFVMTVYAHNEKNLVNVNDVVTKGQQIATVGATGNAQGSHLHFEYRIKGKAINPRKVLPLP